MESRTTALKVSFEDLNISIERKNNSNELLDNRKENRKPITRKNKHIPSYLPKEDLVEKSFETPPLVVNDARENDKSGRLRKSGIQKLGIDKAKSFVSRLRGNTLSPKQSRRTPEFDNIGLLHKNSKELEEAMPDGEFDGRTLIFPYGVGYTELLYLHRPSEECLSSEEIDKIPRIEDKKPGIRHQSSSQSDTNENMENPTPKDTRPRYEDRNFRFKGFMPGDKVPTFYEPNLENPTHKKARNTFEERKPRHMDTNCRLEDKSPRYEDKSPRFEDKSPRFEDKSPRFDGRSPTFEDRRLDVIPGFQHPEFADSRFVDTRRSSNVSVKNGTIPTGRLFLPPARNDCEKKSCSTLSPHCTRRLRASTCEGLPRVPAGKLNLVQSGAWQRLGDEDSYKSRNRSFTR